MEKLKSAFENFNISYTDKTFNMFKDYMDGIIEFNKSVNLTAITDRNEFISKHFVDSIVCANMDEYINAESIIDVGTGAGFPGIPLAIVSPDKKFTLADSLNKRIKIINQLSDEINLTNITTVHGRAEELARNKTYREKFDICVSRAVANLTTLTEYCLPFVKVGGYMFAYKGPVAEDEIATAENAIKILGGNVVRIEPSLFEGYNHNIVVIKKIKNTPAKYPRKAGTPSKEPIK